TTLGYALDGVAALVALILLVLLTRVVVRHRLAAARPVPPLVRALALVRQARTQPVEDRRRAVGLPARTLQSHAHSALRSFASRLAWSKREPVPERLDELVRMVESSEGPT